MPKGNSLTDFEVGIIKNLLSGGKYTNQQIAGLVNRFRGGASNDVNSGRITNIKKDEISKYIPIKAATDDDLAFFFRKIDAYDNRTALNLYDHERLIRARESMILAVQVFNNPGVQFKTEVFAVLSNIAWTYLLHEFYERRGVIIIQEDGRALLLSQMLKRSDCPLSVGIINNLNDIIDIRNDVEHKILKRADLKFFSKFQTCCLNFDKIICELFGDKLTLKNELSVALQFAKLDFGQIQTLHKYDIPEYIEALDAKLHDRRTEEEKADLDYQFRVVFTLENASKSQAHIQFVKPGSEEGKEIHYVLEKYKAADEIYPYRPTDVCKEIKKKTGKNFTMHNHHQAVRLHKARPSSKARQPENTDKKYCIYHPAYRSYTYSQSWVDLLGNICSNDEEYLTLKSLKLR